LFRLNKIITNTTNDEIRQLIICDFVMFETVCIFTKRN
jgi:hypothetical protein